MFEFSVVFSAVSFVSRFVLLFLIHMFSASVVIKVLQFTSSGSVVVVRYLIAERLRLRERSLNYQYF